MEAEEHLSLSLRKEEDISIMFGYPSRGERREVVDLEGQIQDRFMIASRRRAKWV